MYFNTKDTISIQDKLIGFDKESILDIRNSFPNSLIVQLINNRAILTCAQVLINTHVTIEVNGHVCDVSCHTILPRTFLTPQAQDMKNVY